MDEGQTLNDDQKVRFEMANFFCATFQTWRKMSSFSKSEEFLPSNAFVRFFNRRITLPVFPSVIYTVKLNLFHRSVIEY